MLGMNHIVSVMSGPILSMYYGSDSAGGESCQYDARAKSLSDIVMVGINHFMRV
jgi:hypothetical protein